MTQAETFHVEPVRTLHGDEILEWLRQPGTRPFRYRYNHNGLVFLTIVGGVTLALAGLLAWFASLTDPANAVSFLLLVAITGWTWARVARWVLHAKRSFVGLSPTELLIARDARATVVPLSRINSATVDMAQSRPASYTNVLPIRLPELNQDVLLICLYTRLEHFEFFLGELLEQMDDDAQEPPNPG